MDSTFSDIFNFKFKIGVEKALLTDPDAIVLSEQMARKIFGNDDPVGKEVKLFSEIEKIYVVKGIAETPPSNSSITFDVIVPSHSARFSHTGADFILATKNFNKEAFIKKISTLGQQHFQFRESALSIIPLGDIYYNKEFVENSNNVFTRSGSKRDLHILYVIMVVIIFITVLNYSNLQIVHINSGIRQLGINKINGAAFTHYILQRAFELLILIILSAVLVAGVYYAVLPYFNELTGVVLLPDLWKVLLLVLAIIVAITCISMLYPMIVMLHIPVIKSLETRVTSSSNLMSRKTGIVVQFSLAISLIMASVVIYRQLDLMLSKDPGFVSDNVMRLQMFHELPRGGTRVEMYQKYLQQQDHYQYIKNELSSHSTVACYSQGDSPIETYPMDWKLKSDPNEYTTQKLQVVSPSYLELLGLQIIEGRFFDPEMDQSREDKVVINEAAKKYWGIEDIRKARLLNSSWSAGDDTGYEIIGVIKDFNFDHLSVKPQPLIMIYFEDVDNDFLIRFEEGSVESGLTYVKQLYEKINPGEAFQYTFIADEIEALYQKEKRLSKVYILFTIVALFITSLGLFTISIYDAQRRTKEIGIRKVNGAKVTEVMTMLGKDFIKWVGVAFVIATPIAGFAMNKWLQNFAYKTSLSWWIFALAGMLALGISLLTISWQSYRAASRNPVEALRYE